MTSRPPRTPPQRLSIPPTSRRPVALPSRARPPQATSPQPNDERKVALLLDKIQEVCPIPAAAQRVLALTLDVNCDIRKIAEAIAGDPAIAAEAMKLSNSAVFRRGKPIDTLGQAILTLGLQQIRDMASAMEMMAAFSSEQELSLRFHASSVLAGTIAGMSAGELNADAGAAFLAGLLSEIGAMACVAIDGDRFAQIYQQAGKSWELRAELEQKRYGAASWQIGARLLARNQLPAHICSAVASHYGDEEASQHDALQRVTQFGRMAALEIQSLPEGGQVADLVPRIVELAWLAGLPDPKPEQIGLLVERAIASAEAKIASAR